VENVKSQAAEALCVKKLFYEICDKAESCAVEISTENADAFAEPAFIF